MRSLIATLLTAVTISSLPAVEPFNTNLEEIARLAEGLRLDRSQSQEEEKKRQSDYILQLLDLLADFGAHESWETALAIFLKESLSEASQFRIVDSKTTPFHGNSDDELFFIYDLQGSMRYVVKAFRQPDQLESAFLPEIAGNSLLASMQLPHLSAVSSLAIGKCMVEDIPQGLLLVSVAPGRRMDQYLTAVAALKEGHGRSKKMQEAVQAFTAMGIAYGELHQPDVSERVTLSEKWINKLKLDLEKLDQPDIAENLKDILDLAALKAYGDQLSRSIEKALFTPCFEHGSAHLRNIFYDGKKITLIDMGKLHHSVDRSGLPFADSAFDLVRIREFVSRTTLDLLTRDEVRCLLDALDEGYRSVRPLPDHRLLQFYTFQMALHKMLKFFDEDPVKREKHALSFYENVIYLQDVIQKN